MLLCQFHSRSQGFRGIPEALQDVPRHFNVSVHFGWVSKRSRLVMLDDPMTFTHGSSRRF